MMNVEAKKKLGMDDGSPKTRIYMKIPLTSFSASAAEASTFPIDLTKVRLQLHGQSLSCSGRTNAFRIAADIFRQQGPLGLYRGLSPAIFRQHVYSPIRIVGYENLRNFAAGATSDGSLSIFSKAFLGGISGVVAQVVASPADLLKVRMQADSSALSQGLPPRYTGPFDALNKIVRGNGVTGLWKGVVPNMHRAFLVNMAELASYDHAKRFVIRNHIAEDNAKAHILSSLMSGLASTACSLPADVVKTRMMNQAGGKEGKAVVYKNSFDCLVKTVRIEGVLALWKGFFPTWARLGPFQFVFWVTYEKCRSVAGLSSF